jgi:hypothetical protein
VHLIRRLFMPASHTDPLHELILSLTPSEKRYFKLQNAPDSGTKSYLQLFDVLEGLATYDELAIRNELKGQKILNQLHVGKNYLYKQILRSLRSFHAGSGSQTSPFLAFAEHLGDMSILQSKGLFDQSKKALRKAEAIAEEYDDDLFRLIISTYESDRISELVERKSRSQDRFKHRVHLLERLRNSFALKHSLEDLYDILALKGTGDGSHNDIDAIVIEELPFSGQIDYCSYKCFDHFSRDEYAEAATWAKQALDLFDRHPHQRDKSTEIYLSFLSNYFACLQNADYETATSLRDPVAFDRAIEAFDHVTARTSVQKTRVWATRRLAEFEWAFHVSNDEKLQRLLSGFEQEFSAHQKRLSKLEQAWFYFTAAKAFFWTGDRSESLRWLNRLLDESEFKQYEEYYGQALLFSLILHYELGNTDYLKGATASVKRFLESRNLEDEISSGLIKLIGELQKGNTTNSLKEFEQQITELHALPQTRSGIRFFEFDRWIHKKINENNVVTL